MAIYTYRNHHLIAIFPVANLMALLTIGKDFPIIVVVANAAYHTCLWTSSEQQQPNLTDMLAAYYQSTS